MSTVNKREQFIITADLTSQAGLIIFTSIDQPKKYGFKNWTGQSGLTGLIRSGYA